MVDRQIECYKHPGIIKEVFDSVGRVASQVTNTARLESDILNDIGGYILKHPDNYRKKRYIRRIIHSKISVAKRRNRLELASFLIDEATEDNEGQAIEYEPEDVLANVASAELEIKETITLLAKDDRRRTTILTEWMNGNTNDTDISSILADTIGGQARSHRIFIQRFRIECRTELTAQAI